MIKKVEKGARNERKIKKFYEKKGFNVEKVIRIKYHNKDFFKLFDLIAVKKDEKIKFIQVKSNKPQDKGKIKKESLKFIPLDHADVILAVWHDEEGITLWKLDKIAWIKTYDETNPFN